MATAKKTAKKKTAKKKTAKKKTATRRKKVPTTSQVTAPKKKTATRRRTRARKTASTAKTARKKPTRTVSPEERYKMIEQAAYYIAERHHFQGDPQAFWVQAEAEVSARLAKA